LDKELTKKAIKEKILSADIIYVGGGNTLKMMMLWRKLGVDTYLKQAHINGVVLSGLSAGAICWFRHGESDSRKFNNPNAPYIRVRGLGLVKMLLCPHYDAESERQTDLENMMKHTLGTAIALENCCAIEIIDDTYRIITSKKSANAYRVYWSKRRLRKELIEKSSHYKPLKEIISK
jgi:dipeptidase E